MKRIKRILAMAGVILLVLLYLTTLVSAIFFTEATKDLFRISVLATIVVPIMLYVYIMIAKLVTKEKEDDDADC